MADESAPTSQPGFFARLMRWVRGDEPVIAADYAIETNQIYGMSEARYLQVTLRNLGLYNGEIDGEIVSPGLFGARIEPDMVQALEAYAELRRAEGVELEELDFTRDRMVFFDVVAHSPVDIRTPRYYNALASGDVSPETLSVSL